MSREKFFTKKENDLELKFGDFVSITGTKQGIDFKNHIEGFGFDIGHKLKVSKIEGNTYFLFDTVNKETYSIKLGLKQTISMYLRVTKRVV